MTFKEWCIDNSRQDLLNRWDYDLNLCDPNDISIGTHKKYFFRCPRNIHTSELYYINTLLKNSQYELQCKHCKSFAQMIIDKYGEEYLESIWHEDNQTSPWDIGAQSSKKFLFRCNNHHVYKQSPSAKYQGQSCPYCSNRKLLKENSLGVINPEVFNVWSEKNDLTPFDYSPHSGKKVVWKCHNHKHDDYLRKISTSNICQFLCPKCQVEKLLKAKKYEDLTGCRFGHLTVIDINVELTEINQTIIWNCICDCGNMHSVRAAHLKNGSINTCGDRSVHRQGENNSNWKNGSTPKLIQARTNRQYEDWRNQVYAKDYYTCQCCGKTNTNINAHHILNFAHNEELRYDVNNGITLCEECHAFRIKGSFHNIYGTNDNTPEQLEEYINNKRHLLNIQLPFNITKYLKGKILKLYMIEKRA